MRQERANKDLDIFGKFLNQMLKLAIVRGETLIRDGHELIDCRCRYVFTNG